MADDLKALDAVLRALIDRNTEILKHRPAPAFAASGVVYQPWPAGESLDTVDVLLERGHGDADSLAAWRVAELRAVGIDATFEIRHEPLPSSFGHYYRILVRLPDGSVEDPTRK